MGRSGYILVGVSIDRDELSTLLEKCHLVSENRFDYSVRRLTDPPGTKRYSLGYIQLEGKGLTVLVGKMFSCYRSSESSEIVEASEVKLETLLEAVKEVREDFENPNVYYKVGLIDG